MASRLLRALAAVVLSSTAATADDNTLYQSDFPPDEFTARRANVFDQIGEAASALVQGAPQLRGFGSFRQNNSMYYLCGIAVPRSYLLLDGRSRKTTLFLPPRNEGLERSEGKVLSSEDVELAGRLTGIDDIQPLESLTDYLASATVVFTPFAPAEEAQMSRDTLRGAQRSVAADPWDGRPSRRQHFRELLKQRHPKIEIKDLSPILDGLRLIKSRREIELLRRAGQLSALALIEAMRCTEPGVMEYELGAAASYTYLINGARGAGYRAIIAGGANAWLGHYFHNNDVLKDGDLLLMDQAPDVSYYTSDMGRMWPVNGKYSEVQRELYGYIVEYHKTVLALVRPGVTADEIHREAARKMEKVIERTKFSKPVYEKAARATLTFRGHLSHPVGMAVHDVGSYREGPLRAGMVFAVDPQMWIPEEKRYIRIEDTVVVTADGVENFTGFAPIELDDVERLMKEEGLLQFRPATPPSDRRDALGRVSRLSR